MRMAHGILGLMLVVSLSGLPTSIYCGNSLIVSEGSHAMAYLTIGVCATDNTSNHTENWSFTADITPAAIDDASDGSNTLINEYGEMKLHPIKRNSW